ncbi:ABC transporter ATP-binding protein [Saccharopolyspora taberi]|uniref:ABC transporter ATP-binding protein n=1 Tax=Saccharopolyspora taberi TaxID=60895 RepID=A0ABN3V5T2_9PSEU
MRDGFCLLRRHLLPHRRALGRLALWSAVEATPPLLSGLLVAAAIDRGFLAGLPWIGAGWLLLFAAVQGVAAVATRRLYPWLADVVEPLRDQLITGVITATVRRSVAAATAPGGAGVAHATEQVDTVRGMVSSVLRNARQFLTALVAVAGLALLSPVVAALVAPMVLVAVLGFAWVLRSLVDRQRRVILSSERVAAAAEPVLEGVRDVVACGAQDRAAAAVSAAVAENAEAGRAYARARVARVLVLVAGVHVPLLVLLVMSPWLIAHHFATAGVIGGAVVYLSQQLDPALRFLVNAGSTWLVTLGVVLTRLAEVTGGPPPTATRAGIPAPGRNLRLEAVTFSYSAHAAPVIADLSCDIPAGAHLAVVGPSGVGKSTLADLLTGIAQPQRGRVLFGGVPVHDVAGLRREIALIPQEAYVFAGTVRENLALLRTGATTTEIEHAAAEVGSGELIDRLGGLDAEIPPGAGTLSAGQRQLLALTRVWLSPARVVVLDEATCHLDPDAEAGAETAFQRRGGTLVVLAHRMSSALRADRILVLDGETAVLGSHSDLLVRSPLYADLVGFWQADRTSEAEPAQPHHALARWKISR